MKRVISILLIVIMAFSGIAVFADSGMAKDMETVLLKVKQKVEIPQELTEFVPYSSEHNGVVGYSFMWSNKEGGKMIEISADQEGRILHYYSYDNQLKATKKLTYLSKDEIIDTAEEFLKRIAPEAFSDVNDSLIYDEKSWEVNTNSYNMSFIRRKNGVEVKDNNANVQIMVYDDVPFVRNAYINFNYDAKFEISELKSETTAVENEIIEEKYKQAFPIEMIYTDEYQLYYVKSDSDKKDNVLLLYRYKDSEAGYISPQGEIVEEDELNEIYREVSSDTLYSSAGAKAENENFKAMLTEQEIKELKEIEGLILQEEAEKILKKLPYIDFLDTMKANSHGVNKYDDVYKVSISFENDDMEYITATFDGKSGEVLNLYNRNKRTEAKKEELTEAEVESISKKLDEFLKVVAPVKLKEFKEIDTNKSVRSVGKSFDRLVNDVRYIDDTISVSFDADSDRITYYSIDYEEKDFPDTKPAIDAEKAYDAMLEIAPIKAIYIQSGGVFRLCYTASEVIRIDAFTGEKHRSRYEKEEIDYAYSDVKGHWAEEKINKLAEVQIGLEGENFNPDAPITQLELLKLFAAGVRYRSYLGYDEEELYRELITEEILAEAEKNPDGKVKREDAFVYMVRLDGLDAVAKLYEIFKVEYEDGNQITAEKLGYPAILTGMGIICGNGGRVRPQEAITRAEAAVMVYNYMIKK